MQTNTDHRSDEKEFYEEEKIVCPDCKKNRFSKHRLETVEGSVEVVYECLDCGAIITEN